jgi:hypothetical protein
VFIDKFKLLNIVDKEKDVHMAVKTHRGTALVGLNNPSHLRKFKLSYTMGAQRWFPAKLSARKGGSSWEVQYDGRNPQPAAPCTLHPAPYTLHPTPYTLHPTPYTLHPTPFTLHPTPYTLHPTPFTLGTGETETLDVSAIQLMRGSTRVKVTDPEGLEEQQAVSAKKSDELRMNHAVFEIMRQEFGLKQVRIPHSEALGTLSPRGGPIPDPVRTAVY